ncbi:lytic transglycosylase domain-containing protein [Chthonobacter rhizosphaerae]|uniref:lytic transglycosylase domain-containing protein n=1 Tax=Chthonobacter rhizosphaerae TaxID=2735553 RepID=UPI0015EF6020|nr:lytic transglycosylase domain-containing protein [Chthonobacter rhizosphaerae]
MKSAFEWVYTPQTTAARPASPKPSNSAVSDRIEQAFAAASDTTGTSFEYLLKTAQRESSLDTTANARTSSAAGLFQFIESTWLATMKTAGADFGLGRYADAIERSANGRYTVRDPGLRREILDLRYDPDISSMMAGALTRQNASYLAGRLGREASAGELYIAHFLGARGAASFIALAEASPQANAASAFPRQAGANRHIFYDGDGARTIGEVYGELVRLHRGNDPAGGEPVRTAAVAGSASTASVDETVNGLVEPSPEGVEIAARIAGADAVLGYADPGDRVRAGWTAAAASGAFESLFRTDGPSKPVGQTATFFRGFSLAPGLFEMAAAADTAAAETAAAEEAQPLSTPGPSPFAEAERKKRRGPLDLTRFLNIKS